MNPLSPLTYYRRHMRLTLLLASLVTLVTLGVTSMVGMLHPVMEHNAATILGPLTHFSLVYPSAGSSLEPTVASQIRAHPDVAQAVPENGLGLLINVPSLGIASSFRVLGLSEADVQPQRVGKLFRKQDFVGAWSQQSPLLQMQVAGIHQNLRIRLG